MTTPSLQTHPDPRTGPSQSLPAAAGSGQFTRVALRLLPYLVVAAAIVALGLPMLEFPFGSDQAIFAEIGRVISGGGWPYTDAWDQKPPAIYLIYAVAIHGPLGVMRNVRAFDLAWTVMTALVLVDLGRRWWNLAAGAIAGLLFGGVYVTITGYWYSAQPDSFIALPIALALLLYEVATGEATPAGGRARWRGRCALAGAGILLGFAFQLRFIMVLIIPFLPWVELYAAPRGTRLRLWLARMLWLAAGFVLVQVVLLSYLALGGALGEFIAATRFASGYTRLGGPYAPEGLTTSKYLETLRLSFLLWALASCC